MAYRHGALDSGRRGSPALRRVPAQAIVELSLVIIPLFIIICAIFEFSWIFYNWSYLNNAVSKGARQGAVGATTQQVVSSVQGAVGGIPITTCTVTVSTPAGGSVTSSDRTTGNYLTVSATIGYSSITPLSRLVQMARLDTFKAAATTRIE